MIVAFVKFGIVTLVNWYDKSVPRVGDYAMMPNVCYEFQVEKVTWYAGEPDNGEWDVMIKLE